MGASRRPLAPPISAADMPAADRTPSIPPVTTLLLPDERARVDSAGAGLYRTIHREAFDELVKDLREKRISAVILSVSRCEHDAAARVAAVVREFPRVPTVALLSPGTRTNAESLLRLGNCGVRTLVDVRDPMGWHRLRELLSQDETRDIERAALAALHDDLVGATPDCWRFFEALLLPDRHLGTVRELARALEVLPSTLTSRFFRAKLPAPKRYLAYARLVRAARLLENPGMSVATVTTHLEYSSPQSFGRHLRTLLGLSSTEFRQRYTGDGMLHRFREELVHPYLDALRTLHPLGARPMRIPAVPAIAS